MTFDRDGYIVVRGVVPADELARLSSTFTTLIPDGTFYPRRDDGILWELTGAARHYAPLAAIARDRRYGALVAAALDAPRIQLLQDSLLYKPPREGGALDWHQDHTYVGYLVPPRVVSLRIALVDEDVASGCMRVVAGSHRWGPIGDVRALTEQRVDSLLPALTGEQRDAIEHAQALELAAGDVSIHHCLTLHGSGPNRSERPRRTIILRMFDAACRLDRSRLPAGAEDHFPTEADGQLSPEAFPVVFAAD